MTFRNWQNVEQPIEICLKAHLQKKKLIKIINLIMKTHSVNSLSIIFSYLLICQSFYRIPRTTRATMWSEAKLTFRKNKKHYPKIVKRLTCYFCFLLCCLIMCFVLYQCYLVLCYVKLFKMIWLIKLANLTYFYSFTKKVRNK